MDRMKKINIITAAVLILALFLAALILPDRAVSVSERRKLRTMPEVSVESVFGKKGGTSFMDEFELYAKDQFPLREAFRRINAIFGRTVLGRKEINDLYTAEGHLVKLEDGIHEKDLLWSAGRIRSLVEKYVSGNQIAMAVIPDKNAYLAPKAGYPCMDTEEFIGRLADELPETVHFTDLTKLLTAEDYYRTDTHWRQERLLPIAEALLRDLGRELPDDVRSEEGQGLPGAFREEELDRDFYGVYYGQAALPAEPDRIRYLTRDGMEEIRVTCYDSGSPVSMGIYDFAKAEGMDPYEFFLSGSKALITLENPAAPEGELVCFRDSFGSSLAPLLASSYRKITLVDIRYISPAMLGRFVDFTGADILFLYSTSVLNNSVGQFLQ